MSVHNWTSVINSLKSIIWICVLRIIFRSVSQDKVDKLEDEQMHISHFYGFTILAFVIILPSKLYFFVKVGFSSENQRLQTLSEFQKSRHFEKVVFSIEKQTVTDFVRISTIKTL